MEFVRSAAAEYVLITHLLGIDLFAPIHHVMWALAAQRSQQERAESMKSTSDEESDDRKCTHVMTDCSEMCFQQKLVVHQSLAQ